MTNHNPQAPIAPSRLCDLCGQKCFRQTFVPQPQGGRAWVSRHEKCEPNKPRYERRQAPGTRAPMGYVPSNYPIAKFLKEAPKRTSR